MNLNRFCTLVLSPDNQIYRVLTASGYQPRYGELLHRGAEKRFWHPGRLVDIKFLQLGINTRPSHPEDSKVRHNSCVARDAVLTPRELAERVRPLLRDSLHDLFPGIVIEWQKPFYSGEPVLPRSAGYLHIREGITVVRDGAPGYEKLKAQVFSWQLNQRIILPIKDPAILERIEGGHLAEGSFIRCSTVLLGLATALQHKSGEVRLYLQLLHAIPQG